MVKGDHESQSSSLPMLTFIIFYTLSYIGMYNFKGRKVFFHFESHGAGLDNKQTCTIFLCESLTSNNILLELCLKKVFGLSIAREYSGQKDSQPSDQD